MNKEPDIKGLIDEAEQRIKDNDKRMEAGRYIISQAHEQMKILKQKAKELNRIKNILEFKNLPQ